MKIGLIAPINYLHLCDTGMQLCYSTFLKDSTYYSFYRNAVRDGDMIVLDYSPVLPRVKVDTDSLLSWYGKLKPTLLVLPSVDYFWEKSLQAMRESLRRLGTDKHTVGVLQGVDLDTLALCYKNLKSLVSIIALPSTLEKIASREEIVRDLGIKQPILYLEVYSNPYLEIPPTLALGICSSYPFRLAQASRELRDFKPTPPPLNFNVERGVLDEALVEANIEEYLSCIEEE